MVRRLPLLFALALACKPDIDFNQGHPYACTYGDDSKCGQGWRCGHDMFCHQIGTPGTYQCWRDAGDCEANWVCGVDGFCINPDDAGSNLCLADSDCFHGQRCNVDGRCTPLNGDAIGPTDSPPGPLTVLGPLMAPDGVTNSGVAFAIQPRTGDPQADALRSWTMAAVSGNNVTAITNIFHGNYPVAMVDAGTFSQVQQIATAPNGVYVRTDTGIQMSFTNGNGTQVPVHLGPNPIGNDWDLRSLSATGVGLLPDAGNEHYTCVALAIDGGTDYHLINGLAARPVRQGPEPVRSELFGFGQCLIGVSPDQLWSLAIAGDGGWNALSLPELTTGNTCGGSWTGAPLRARGAQPNLLAVVLDTTPPMAVDGNYPPTISRVALYDLSALLRPTGASPEACIATVDSSCHEARVKMVLGVCGACQQPNEALLDFFPLVLGQSYGVQSDCVINSTLHTYEVTQDLDGTCHQTRVISGEPQFRQLLDPPLGGSNPFALAKAGQHGELWAGENLVDARPMFMDRAPFGLFRPESLDGGSVPLHVFADEWVAEVTPQGLAVRELRAPTPIATMVAGNIADVVLTDRRVGRYRDQTLLFNVFATVNATDQTFLPPYSAKATPRADGKLEFVVRSFDTVYSGHAPDTPVPAWSIKQQVVPSPGIPISSIITQVADSGTDQLQGYALTGAGLFRLAQDQHDAWTSTPLSTGPGNRVQVFMEAGASRLGYDDGTVYALPSRVPLTTPRSDVHFQSFLHACGETWAIADPLGLMRLAPDDGGTGHWVNEPLDSADAVNFSGPALSGGRLFFVNNTIYVFNAYGGALTFAPQQGCNATSDAGM
jgi:hypothetical protein